MERLTKPKQEKEKSRPGLLTVVWGPMFSGKTKELLSIVDQQGYADRSAIIIKPANDTRYAEDQVVTHGKQGMDAYNVNPDTPEQVFGILSDVEQMRGRRVDIVAWDEGQFFDSETIVPVVERILDGGRDVVIAGLAVDANDQPFGAMPVLIAKADKPVFRDKAVCTHRGDDGSVCGEPATKTQRLVDKGGQVLVGGVNEYAAFCRFHHSRREWKE